MIVLDTSVLVYAVGVEHPLREPCRRIVRAIEAGDVAATTSVPVIQEFLHVRARRRDRADAVRLAAAYGGLLEPLLPANAAQLERALSLFAGQPGLDAFDALLAAAAIEAGARALVSADRAFAGLPGLRHVDPASADVDELLRQ